MSARNPYAITLQSKEMQFDTLANVDFEHIPHDPGFLPFFTTDETQCHHYGGRIVAHNASL